MRKIFKEVKSSKGDKTYSVMLVLDNDGEVILSESSCTCVFGSFYGWSKKNREKKKICRHMKEVIEELKKSNKKNDK